MSNPMGTIQFYEAGAKDMGGLDRTRSFDRLFMVPGATLCAFYGPGTYSFHPLPASERWVEDGQAPAALVGTNPNTGLSRPLCTYPKVARLKHPWLDPKVASSFACVDVEEHR